MDDRRAVEGLEHLQAAANELVAAARSFLDVAEEAIADPDRFGGMAAGAVDLLKGLTGRGEQPWERHAWDEPVATDTDTETETEPHTETDGGTETDGEVASQAEEAPKVAPRPAVRAKRKSSASRVTRIAVD